MFFVHLAHLVSSKFYQIMKTLYIVRHAKSSWDHPELHDRERPLLEKGKKRTRHIIEYFLENNISVDLILSSPAVRALETARLIARAMNYPIDDIHIHNNIYTSDAEKLHNIFFDLPQDINSLMITGHNPTLTTFANYFLEKKIDWIPTSGVVSISFDTNKWEDLYTSAKKLNFYITPKELSSKKKKNKK